MNNNTELKPCPKCKFLCRVKIVLTAASKYRIGCTIHNVWQKIGFDSIGEATSEWNRRTTDERAE